ncbi:MAG: KH domain-containing protein [Chlamydiota bacterium]|nr:KH domain-containing protein [Chlamydiota bacterium]
MKELVEYIVKNIVENPEEVSINIVNTSQTMIIEVTVSQEDIGKLIGKKGHTINALRSILMTIASKEGLRVNIEVIESNTSSSDS